MNCPSRVDENLFHPDWNQNPPFLASDLTTRQDLGGIANSREHKYDDLGPGNASIDGAAEAYLSQVSYQFREKQSPASLGRDGLLLPLKDDLKSFTGQLTSRLNHTISTFYDYHQRNSSAAWPVVSGFLFTLTNAALLLAHYGLSNRTVRHNNLEPVSFPPNPNGLLEAHSVVKRDTCLDNHANQEYDLPLHVGAVFIILFVSGTACAFPLVVLKVPRLRIPSTFLFAARHFGTGVLIATAFVHLLPTAFGMLGDPCLSNFWTSDYPAMPGAIVLAAVFFVTIIEMVFTPVRSCYPSTPPVASNVGEAPTNDQSTAAPIPEATSFSPLSRSTTNKDNEVPMRNLGLLKGRSSSVGQRVSRLAENREITEIRQPEALSQQYAVKDQSDPKQEDFSRHLEPQHSSNSFEIELTPEQKHKKAIMQCALLELGILFHSVFIGMALSVSSGNDFVVLLIAIVFHQTFEGLALGSRIADIKWHDRAMQPWLMALAYGCTTPIGQALGLGLHTLYNPGSELGLLLVGIMNAISSGLLVYASLVELLSEDFLSDESWRVLRGKRRIYACLLVFLGAFGMSLIGAWA